LWRFRQTFLSICKNEFIYNQHGELVSSSFDGLWDGSLDNAVAYDEYGAARTWTVWTGNKAIKSAYTPHYVFQFASRLTIINAPHQRLK